MITPSVLPSNIDPFKNDGVDKFEEVKHERVVICEINSNQEIAHPAPDNPDIKSGSTFEPSKHYAFINDFVTSFLHPYISGQRNNENEAPNRPSLVELLLKNIPDYDPLHRDEIVDMAFQAYLKAAALGLYVNRKVIKGIIASYSEEFGILVSALEQSIPKDFCCKKISQTQLETYAIEALMEVNKERIRLAQETYERKYEITYEKIVKIIQLKQSGKLFFSDTNLPTNPINSMINQLETDLVSMLDNTTLEGMKSIENQLLSLESFLAPTQTQTHEHIYLSKRLALWKILFVLLDKFIDMKSSKYGSRGYEVELIKEDIHDKYTYYLEHGQSDPYFYLFVKNVLDIFELIKHIKEFTNLLKKLDLHNTLIGLHTETLDQVQWNTLVYPSLYDNQDEIQTITANSTQCYAIFIEAGKMLENLSDPSPLKYSILEFIQKGIVKDDMPHAELRDKFQKLISKNN